MAKKKDPAASKKAPAANKKKADPAPAAPEGEVTNLPIEEQKDAWQQQTIANAKELEDAKARIIELEGDPRLHVGASDPLPAKSAPEFEAEKALMEAGSRTDGGVAASAMPGENYPHYDPAETATRIVAAGTRVRIGDTVVTLVNDTCVTFDGADNEQKFVGMLLGSEEAGVNFDANKRNLRLIYNRSTGALVPMVDQSDKGLANMDDNEKRLLGVEDGHIEAEIARRKATGEEAKAVPAKGGKASLTDLSDDVLTELNALGNGAERKKLGVNSLDVAAEIQRRKVAAAK